MTHAAARSSRPFAFDTEFDGDGAVVSVSSYRPTKRAYLPAEVDALVAQARVEAREAALAEAESLERMAMAEIGRAMAVALPGLGAAAQAHREQSAALALACARAIASVSLDRLPTGPLAAALESLAQEIDATPRLVVRAGGLSPATQDRIASLAAEAGFTGQVAFRDDPSAPLAAFQLEWADGRAEFDPDAAAARVAETLSAALAAEAGHAEAPIDGRVT